MSAPADPDDLPTKPWDRDDDLLRGVRDERAPRAAVYRWDTVAVVIGRGGRQSMELHRAAIARDGVPLYRRPGGGCAVVLDPGNLVVAVGLPLAGIGGITSAFAAISAWLGGLLAACAVPAVEQRGVSDLVQGDRKVGGSCIWRTRALLNNSTTQLVTPDLDLVERYLPHPPREPDYRQGRAHRDFMAGLRARNGAADPDALAAALDDAAGRGLPALARTTGCG